MGCARERNNIIFRKFRQIYIYFFNVLMLENNLYQARINGKKKFNKMEKSLRKKGAKHHLILLVAKCTIRLKSVKILYFTPSYG